MENQQQQPHGKHGGASKNNNDGERNTKRRVNYIDALRALIAGRYTIDRELYRGYISRVYKATETATRKKVALKAYCLTSMPLLQQFQVGREVHILQRIKHAGMVKLRHVLKTPGSDDGSDGPDKSDVYLVMVQDYVPGGDLFTYARSMPGRKLPPDTVASIIRRLLETVAHLHAQGIIHRDIKPENILLTRDDGNHNGGTDMGGGMVVPLLTDFGLAIDIRLERAVTRAGTLEYMAPEVIMCSDKLLPQDNKDNVNMQYGSGVDIWGVGVLTYELLTGVSPFGDRDNAISVGNILRAAPNLGSWIPSIMPPAAADFIAKCLAKDAKDRPTARELLWHPFVELRRVHNHMVNHRRITL
jgi:serine/threonine protein kinase